MCRKHYLNWYYALRQRIQAEETRLRTYYEDFRTKPPGATGVLAGGLTGAIAIFYTLALAPVCKQVYHSAFLFWP
ncbi:hypothetical protein NIES2100_12500 [Calothrix sp. NIES-2100]|nr:hypothetical protein NIES2100_12500 [Calothrix sp. NIES-2100]